MGGEGVDTLVCEEGGATCASQTRAGRVPSWSTSLVPGQEEQGVTLRLPMDYREREKHKEKKNYKL